MSFPLRFVIVEAGVLDLFNARAGLRTVIQQAAQNGVGFGVLGKGGEEESAVQARQSGLADIIPAWSGQWSEPLWEAPNHAERIRRFLHQAGYLGMYESVMAVCASDFYFERARDMGMRAFHARAEDGEAGALRLFRDIALEAMAEDRKRPAKRERLTA